MAPGRLCLPLLTRLKGLAVCPASNSIIQRLRPCGSDQWQEKRKNFSPKNFKWAENKVKVLGIWISTDPNTTLNLNYREKADKIRNVLSCWRYRRLTLMGKILVIKSLAASQLTYILAPLATNHEIIREINDLFYSYLWNNKGDKIKRSVIISEYEKGGLKMVDIATFQQIP